MRTKVCLLTTSLLIVKFFLRPHLRALSERYDVTLLVNVHDEEFLRGLDLPVRVVHVPIERNISVWKDLKALFWLVRFLHKEKMSLIHTVAPKAGLLGMLAGWLARVPHRLHVFQGEVWLTRTGVWRFILKNIDRLVASLSTHLQVVSRSEREFLIKERIISPEKSRVLLQGSIGGVDMNVFRANASARNEVRKQNNISGTARVVLYIGRLNRDKGVLDLFQAFSRLQAENTHLLVVGPDEENIGAQISAWSGNKRGKVHLLPYTPEPEKFFAAADILVLPSYREGFGVVIIEAAAAEVPAVASRIYGVTDAVEDGETGLLFEPKDVEDLTAKLQRLITDENSRKEMGRAAQKRCEIYFRQDKLMGEYLKFYREILNQ